MATPSNPAADHALAEALGFSATEVEQQLARDDDEITKVKERLSGVDGEG